MTKKTLGFTFAMATLLMTACSAPEPQPTEAKNPTKPAPSGSASNGGNTGTSADEVKSDEGCVTKDDKGNALGVGAYCDKTTRCKTGQFCSGDFGAPEGASFCTIVCATDADCGQGATCYAGDSRGKGCVPNACVSK